MRKIILFWAVTAFCLGASAQEVTSIGIIGLDTSHSTEFSKLLNGTSDDELVRKYEVVAAYPYGSRTVESAATRIPQYIAQVKEYGVEIVNSIEELLEKVDVVFLETNDGHPHLEQAEKVFKAGKKCYIDKPLGATLAQCIAIYERAEHYGIKIFSSSALRFSKVNADIRAGIYGPVRGADCYSPHYPEPSHPDFGFYGIHGVEILYTAMGTGCESVSRVHSPQGDIVTGLWKDGRIGTFRAITSGNGFYGGQVFLENGVMPAGGYEGYMVLLREILKFFETDTPPVSKEEILEMFAFMEASNLSAAQDGRSVRLETVYKDAEKEAAKLIEQYR